MPPSDRGGLKTAFANFNTPEGDREAELKLLGRTIEPDQQSTETLPERADSYRVATIQPPATGLTPRPLLHREVVRQLSFRCPIGIAGELKRKAAFNQLEQQQIIVEGLKRVLSELPDPPAGWEA